MLNVLEQASEVVKNHWPRSNGWKAFSIVSLIILAILGVVGATLYFGAQLVKGLTSGGFHNKDLYIPRMR